MSKKLSFETLCIQEGYKPKVGEPRILPIVQNTTYYYNNPDYVGELFDLSKEGHMYSRISNPTVAALEEKFSLLEGGVGAVATSSGQSATLLAVLNICKAGDHILAASTLYGGTFNLLNVTLRELGIHTTFVNPEASEEEILCSIKNNTKLIFGETIGNPGLNILDFEKFSSIARKSNIPFIVDNTIATPYHCNPLRLGANIVIHSTTKYADGHATSVGGIIIDGGNFNWDNGKFLSMVEKDLSYHGLKYVEAFKEKAYITKLRVKLLRDIGNIMSPFNAFLTNLGLETLHLRMKAHSENALKLAKWLQKHPKISWVNYPRLEDNINFQRSNKYLRNGASGMLTFGIKGSKEDIKEFIKKLKLVALVIHIGDVRSSVLHPASTTHRQLSVEEQINAGVSPEMIRVSVGIENIEDIIEDFKQALNYIS
ncbi:O-acetylhomoserine aminocarboxypropyltransferase/cysteine synthase family protein [Clostridium sp. KNHs214]|uniref:O-acetylhomoserine aminocarboxypropyltransferase/cysteine synthase family protein n=1 Tax=Clostridium sp. KNHs214 TaxID=1540257 RepID=UPI00054DE898|nr:O-acetylhomoserine aminocarboxypropyltransferase/cysteine synthase family protein [Clostridium sp. KNHs214]